MSGRTCIFLIHAAFSCVVRPLTLFFFLGQKKIWAFGKKKPQKTPVWFFWLVPFVLMTLFVWADRSKIVLVWTFLAGLFTHKCTSDVPPHWAPEASDGFVGFYSLNIPVSLHSSWSRTCCFRQTDRQTLIHMMQNWRLTYSCVSSCDATKSACLHLRLSNLGKTASKDILIFTWCTIDKETVLFFVRELPW